MSVSEALPILEAMSPDDCAEAVARTFLRLDPEQQKAFERRLRRLMHPDVPDEVWEGFEDAEDGRFVDMETALHEEPPPWVLDRSLPRPDSSH
jgi:hypothetical protein